MRRPAPLCDCCGRALAGLADARVVLVFDDLDRLVGAALDHAACVAGPPGPGDRIETLPARDLILDARTAQRLAALARLHTAASVKRLVRRCERLATVAA